MYIEKKIMAVTVSGVIRGGGVKGGIQSVFPRFFTFLTPRGGWGGHPGSSDPILGKWGIIMGNFLPKDLMTHPPPPTLSASQM